MTLAELIKKHPETYSGIAISTGNLSTASREWLEDQFRISNVILKRDTGFILKLYQDFLMAYEDMPKELEHIIETAINAGFTILEFDSDATPCDLFVYFGE